MIIVRCGWNILFVAKKKFPSFFLVKKYFISAKKWAFFAVKMFFGPYFRLKRWNLIRCLNCKKFFSNGQSLTFSCVIYFINTGASWAPVLRLGKSVLDFSLWISHQLIQIFNNYCEISQSLRRNNSKFWKKIKMSIP